MGDELSVLVMIREDLQELRQEVRAATSDIVKDVRGLERAHAQLKGALGVFALVTPFLAVVLQHFVG